jgi:hypothetical protein
MRLNSYASRQNDDGSPIARLWIVNDIIAVIHVSHRRRAGFVAPKTLFNLPVPVKVDKAGSGGDHQRD